jgi:hypothetical protein
LIGTGLPHIGIEGMTGIVEDKSTLEATILNPSIFTSPNQGAPNVSDWFTVV